MGISSNDYDDLELQPVADEARLPLYSEVDATEPSEVPGVDATPDKVREFFQNLLVAKRHDSGEHAARVAALWTRGSGRELKSYPPQMFLKIFGPEDGWLLYRETQLIKLRESPEAKRRKRIVKFSWLAAALIWELSMVLIGITNLDSVWLGIAIFGGLFGGILVILMAFLAFLPEQSVEDRIENELRACVSKTADAA